MGKQMHGLVQASLDQTMRLVNQLLHFRYKRQILRLEKLTSEGLLLA